MSLFGVKLLHKKNTADMEPVRIAVPETVTIPMSMHIGKPSRLLVGKGDTVRVGQRIASADGFVSADIHASVSGTVTQVGDRLDFHGEKVTCVTIQADGKQTPFEQLQPPGVDSFEDFKAAVKASGVVGLGGAGFPTFVKLSVKDLSKIEYVIINGAECEPYITSDTRTMLDKGEYIFKGIEMLKKYMGISDFVIGIESNKPRAIEKMRALAAKTQGVQVKVLKPMYPQGGEKVLIYHTLGRIVPRHELPLSVGVIVINVTTLAFIAEYLETGMPLVEKCVTVDGSAVKEPKNVIAPIGTSLAYLLEQAGGCVTEPKKVLYGGPMMGMTVPDLDEPVLKNTNAVIAMDEKEAAVPKTTACIGCGSCGTHCPMHLDPRAIAKAYQLRQGEVLDRLCVDLCMECGCCSYVCPANRPLVQTNRLAKGILHEYMEEQRRKVEAQNE